MAKRQLNNQEKLMCSKAICRKKANLEEATDELKVVDFKLDFELEHGYKKERKSLETYKAKLETQKKIDEKDIDILTKQIKEGVDSKSTQEE